MTSCMPDKPIAIAFPFLILAAMVNPIRLNAHPANVGKTQEGNLALCLPDERYAMDLATAHLRTEGHGMLPAFGGDFRDETRNSPA